MANLNLGSATVISYHVIQKLSRDNIFNLKMLGIISTNSFFFLAHIISTNSLLFILQFIEEQQSF